MLRGLYSAASGLESATEYQDVTAHNLANTSTPGYRQRGLISETFDRVLGRTLTPTGDVVGTRVAGAYHDFRPGPIQHTGYPFDFALSEPDQFFTLDGPNGRLYTRNGSFRLTPQGELLSQSGYPVRGEDGPIRVPPETVRLDITQDGTVIADGNPAGRIRPVRFADLSQLTAAGPTLYAAGPGAGPQAADGRILRGYKEGSNVQPADAMVRMILSTRFFDAAQRSLRTISESLQLNTRPTGG